jgi:putative hydrolase of the HAD superfamily
VNLPQWLFFDCCQTLIDIDDVSKYWTWMAPISVEVGACSSEEAFNRAYAVWQRQRRQEAAAHPHPENPLSDGLAQILVGLDSSVSLADIEITVGRMIEAFYANYLPRTHPAPGVRRMLDAWQGTVKMGVVSDFFLCDCPRRMLAKFDLDGYFEFVLDSASVGFRKPAPEIYLKALKRAELAADQVDEVMFVGDNLALDVVAPADMGMRAMYYNPRWKDQAFEEQARFYLSTVHWDEFRPDLVAERGGLR